MRILNQAVFAALVVVQLACGVEATDGADNKAKSELKGKVTVVTTPVLTVLGVTPTTISLQVCAPAGGTGLPAGFSVQYMDADLYNPLTGWPLYTVGDEFCKASFSGNANTSRFPLAAGACTTVEIGNLFDDEAGVSFSCQPDDLTCGNDYVFRAFGHATATLSRSAFTSNTTGTTTACVGPPAGCTLTQGYWKTHGPIPTGNNSNEWDVTSLTLGSVSYTDLELQSIFNTPAAGNGLIALAHQLMAAKLNVANGADDTAVAAAIADADALIGGLICPPVGSGSLSNGSTSALTGALASYNEGLTGPGHCE
jgi:hypothetical protein